MDKHLNIALPFAKADDKCSVMKESNPFFNLETNRSFYGHSHGGTIKYEPFT